MTIGINAYRLWNLSSTAGTIPVVEDLRAQFGRRLRELRTARGLSQEELAERAGLHYTFVGGIERGQRNPGLVSIGALAQALGLSLGEMVAPLRVAAPRSTSKGSLSGRKG